MLSKVGEFFDTVLKILMKKNVIFLHWSDAPRPRPPLPLRATAAASAASALTQVSGGGRYHHMMTAWLGWLALAYDASAGQWYAGLNFTVHAPMYFYYFLSSFLGAQRQATPPGLRARWPHWPHWPHCSAPPTAAVLLRPLPCSARCTFSQPAVPSSIFRGGVGAPVGE